MAEIRGASGKASKLGLEWEEGEVLRTTWRIAASRSDFANCWLVTGGCLFDHLRCCDEWNGFLDFFSRLDRGGMGEEIYRVSVKIGSCFVSPLFFERNAFISNDALTWNKKFIFKCIFILQFSIF